MDRQVNRRSNNDKTLRISFVIDGSVVNTCSCSSHTALCDSTSTVNYQNYSHNTDSQYQPLT